MTNRSNHRANMGPCCASRNNRRITPPMSRAVHRTKTSMPECHRVGSSGLGIRRKPLRSGVWIQKGAINPFQWRTEDPV